MHGIHVAWRHIYKQQHVWHSWRLAAPPPSLHTAYQQRGGDREGARLDFWKEVQQIVNLDGGRGVWKVSQHLQEREGGEEEESRETFSHTTFPTSRWNRLST